MVEYKVVGDISGERHLERKLNDLAEQGWRVVACGAGPTSDGEGNYGFTVSLVIMERKT